MSASIMALTESTFDEEVVATTEPMIVDFWAEWCGPCKQVAPILDEIATEQAGKVRVAKINVDDHPDLARRFGVMSIPTMIIFSQGAEADRLVGARGKGQILEALAPYM